MLRFSRLIFAPRLAPGHADGSVLSHGGVRGVAITPSCPRPSQDGTDRKARSRQTNSDPAHLAAVQFWSRRTIGAGRHSSGLTAYQAQNLLSWHRQGRVASRRTLSPRRLHRDEHEPPARARRCFLQTSAGRASNGSRRAKVRSSGRDCRAERSPPMRCGSSFMPSPTTSAISCAGDAEADQELVADKLEGQVDQDRREGGEPWPICYLLDGRGRHRTANVPGDSVAHRGATAATTSASVRRSMSCIQEQPTEGVRPNARENGQIKPSTKRSGYQRCW